MILSHVSVHSAACLPFFLIKLNLLVFLSEGSTSISTETLFSISYSGCRFYLCLVLPRKWLLRDWLGISLLVGGAECLPLHHLDYFLRFSSMYTSVFILIYEFFLTFPLSILSCIPLWGWASYQCLLSCWQGSTHHMWRKFDFFPKILLIWHC